MLYAVLKIVLKNALIRLDAPSVKIIFAISKFAAKKMCFFFLYHWLKFLYIFRHRNYEDHGCVEERPKPPVLPKPCAILTKPGVKYEPIKVSVYINYIHEEFCLF